MARADSGGTAARTGEPTTATAAAAWRHIVHRIPLRYEATLWSIVFPLGMYGVGGHYRSG